MSPSTTNPDREDATKAIAWYLYRRDRTPATDRTDPDLEAGEIVQALMLRGWRRTEARQRPPWMPDLTEATPADPDTVRARAAEARAGLTRPNPSPTQETE